MQVNRRYQLARNQGGEALLTPSEVAGLYRVDPKTVTRWAKAGRLASIRTLGGHRRYPAAQFAHLLGPAPVAAGAVAGQGWTGLGEVPGAGR